MPSSAIAVVFAQMQQMLVIFVKVQSHVVAVAVVGACCEPDVVDPSDRSGKGPCSGTDTQEVQVIGLREEQKRIYTSFSFDIVNVIND